MFLASYKRDVLAALSRDDPKTDITVFQGVRYLRRQRRIKRNGLFTRLFPKYAAWNDAPSPPLVAIILDMHVERGLVKKSLVSGCLYVYELTPLGSDQLAEKRKRKQ